MYRFYLIYIDAYSIMEMKQKGNNFSIFNNTKKMYEVILFSKCLLLMILPLNMKSSFWKILRL